MDKLVKDWFLMEPLDYEIKQYIIQGYSKAIRESYRKMELHPHLTELRKRIFEIKELLEKERLYVSQLRSPIVAIDLSKQKLIRSNPLPQDKDIDELGRILQFALSQLSDLGEEGTEIVRIISEQLELQTVGLESLYTKEGYLMIEAGNSTTIPVFRFRAGLYDHAKRPVLYFNFLRTFKKTLNNTLESIKCKLIDQFRDFPNPATYVLHSEHNIPIKATLLPLAEEKLINKINWKN